MNRIFVSAGKYIQGKGAISSIGDAVLPFGTSILVTGGNRGLAVTRQQRNESFARKGIEQTEALFGGECCEEEIARLAGIAGAHGCTVIAASGGGKVIDTVKMAAERLNLTCVIIPTTASNDSPCSAVSIIYNSDGTFSHLQELRANPDIVIVDTAIIAAAPVRQLVAGMGDALATWYEAKGGFASGSLNTHGGIIPKAGLSIARLSRDLILENGLQAKRDCENNEVTDALEEIVEANTLLSGLGFENCGVGLAHALSETLTEIPGIHHYLHGETVAFGLLTHLLVAGEEREEFDRVVEFMRGVGLPICLCDIGCEPGEALRNAAFRAAEDGRPSHTLKKDISGEEIYEAMLAADAIGKTLKAR